MEFILAIDSQAFLGGSWMEQVHGAQYMALTLLCRHHYNKNIVLPAIHLFAPRRKIRASFQKVERGGSSLGDVTF